MVSIKLFKILLLEYVFQERGYCYKDRFMEQTFI